MKGIIYIIGFVQSGYTTALRNQVAIVSDNVVAYLFRYLPTEGYRREVICS